MGKSWSYIISHFCAIFDENYRWRWIIMGTSNWNSSPFCFRWKTCCLSPETYSISFKLDADFAGKSKFKKHVFQKVLGERKCYQKCCPFGCIRLLRSKVRMENWTPTKGHYLCYTLFYWHLVMPRLCKDHVEHCSVLNKFSEHSAVRSSSMCRSPLSLSSVSCFQYHFLG